jgi:integrase
LAEGQNPFVKIKERKISENRNRYVNPPEFRTLINAAENVWWKAFLSIAFSSGLRRNEILNLTWGDVDFEHQRISVTAKKVSEKIIAWEPKNRKNRLTPMSDETVSYLAAIQAAATEGHPYIFISPERLCHIKARQQKGKWNSRSELVNNLIRHFNLIRTKANIVACTIHDLRRSAITNWAKALPIQVVQELAGHADIKTTRTYYLAVRPEDMVTANKLMSKILTGMEDD